MDIYMNKLNQHTVIQNRNFAPCSVPYMLYYTIDMLFQWQNIDLYL